MRTGPRAPWSGASADRRATRPARSGRATSGPRRARPRIRGAGPARRGERGSRRFPPAPRRRGLSGPPDRRRSAIARAPPPRGLRAGWWREWGPPCSPASRRPAVRREPALGHAGGRCAGCPCTAASGRRRPRRPVPSATTPTIFRPSASRRCGPPPAGALSAVSAWTVVASSLEDSAASRTPPPAERRGRRSRYLCPSDIAVRQPSRAVSSAGHIRHGPARLQGGRRRRPTVARAPG